MLCHENGLSVIEHPKEHGITHYEHELKKKGQSWKALLREAIDRCIIKARDWEEFLFLMEKEKYEIKPGKYYSFRAEGQERFTRCKTLRAEQKALREEKDRLYKSYDSAKAEYAELQNVKKNMDEIFGREKAQELGRRKKRSGELE